MRARLEEILGDRTPDEVALARRMVGGFAAKAARLLADHDAARGAADVEGAARALHTLKGTALNLGLDELAQASQAWEDRVRTEAEPSPSSQRLREQVVELVAGGSRVLQQVEGDLPPDGVPRVTRTA